MHHKKTKKFFLFFILSLIFLTHCGDRGSGSSPSGTEISGDDTLVPQEGYLKIVDQLSSLSFEELKSYFPKDSSSITKNNVDIFLDNYLSTTHQILQSDEKERLKSLILSDGKGSIESTDIDQLISNHISSSLKSKIPDFNDISQVDVTKLDPDHYSYDEISTYIKSLANFTDEERDQYSQALTTLLDAIPHPAVLDKNGDGIINDNDYFQSSQVKDDYQFWNYFIDTDTSDLSILTPPKVGRPYNYFKAPSDNIIILDFKGELGLKEITLNEAQTKISTLSRDSLDISLNGKHFYQPEIVTQLNKNSLVSIDKIFLFLPSVKQSVFSPKMRFLLKSPHALSDGDLIITPTFWMEFSLSQKTSSLYFFIRPLWAETSTSNNLGEDLKKIIEQPSKYQSDVISTNDKAIFDNITALTQTINNLESQIQNILDTAASSACSNNKGYDNDNGCKLKKTYQALIKLASSLDDSIMSNKADIESLTSILEYTPSANETIDQAPYLTIIALTIIADAVTAIKSIIQKMAQITAKRSLGLTDTNALIGEKIGGEVQKQLISYSLDKLLTFIDTLLEDPLSSQTKGQIKDAVKNRKEYKKVLESIKNVLQKTKDTALKLEKAQNLVKNNFNLFLKYFGAGFIRNMVFDAYYGAEDKLQKKQNDVMVKWAQKTFELRHLKEELPHLITLKNRLDSLITQVRSAIQKSTTHQIQVKNQCEAIYQARTQKLNQDLEAQRKSLTNSLNSYKATILNAEKTLNNHLRLCEEKDYLSHKASEEMKFACRETNPNDLECDQAINASEKALKISIQCMKQTKTLKENFFKAQEELKKQEEFVEKEHKRLLDNLKNDLADAAQVRKQCLDEGDCDSHIPSISNLKDNTLPQTLMAIKNIFPPLKPFCEQEKIDATLEYCYEYNPDTQNRDTQGCRTYPQDCTLEKLPARPIGTLHMRVSFDEDRTKMDQIMGKSTSSFSISGYKSFYSSMDSYDEKTTRKLSDEGEPKFYASSAPYPEINDRYYDPPQNKVYSTMMLYPGYDVQYMDTFTAKIKFDDQVITEIKIDPAKLGSKNECFDDITISNYYPGGGSLTYSRMKSEKWTTVPLTIQKQSTSP